MSHFETYGKIALENIDNTCKNGRYSLQKNSEIYISADIIKKLEINSKDQVIDIGCGTGLNINPISKIASSIVGCDHPNIIKIAKNNNSNNNVTFIGGSFLDLTFKQKFDKVLVYGVLSTLPGKKTVVEFIDKALDLMEPTGRMLLGDMPNIDKKSRFLNSKRGKFFQDKWDMAIEQSDKNNCQKFFSCLPNTIDCDDKFILEVLSHIRSLGHHAYVVDQPQNLPFGNSREDILVVGCEYEDE